jgi:S1-C subfamily serine protease
MLRFIEASAKLPWAQEEHPATIHEEASHTMSVFDPVEPSPGSRSRRLPTVVGLLLLATAFYIGTQWSGFSSRPAAAPRDAAPGHLLEPERHTVSLFRDASPGVAFITTLSTRTDYFTRRVLEIPTGTGSGFVWDEEGHVVTNAHVVQSRGRVPPTVRVKLADQSEWDARVMGFAPEKDLAVLKIDAPAERLHPIPIGSSRDLMVGQSVYAIGNPFGLDQTLTTGVISALGREIRALGDERTIRDVVQTDAAINPGNSGGPLLDSSGRLIGVNTQIYSPSGGSAGIGFAIPVDTVNWVVPDLIAYGGIDRPTLGLVDYDDRVLRRNGLEGVLILDVAPGTGAAAAGLRPTRRGPGNTFTLGDIIVGLGDQMVANHDDLMRALEGYETGDRVPLKILRDGKELRLEVELGPSNQRRVRR